MKSWFAASGSTTRGLLVEPTMGRSESTSQNSAFPLWGSAVCRAFLWGWGQDSTAPLACSVSAVHCGFMALTSISKLSISFCAWRVTENNCGAGFGCCLLFGSVSAWAGWALLHSAMAEGSVCALSVCHRATTAVAAAKEHKTKPQNHRTCTGLSISTRHSVLDPEQAAVGKSWQAFWGFGCCFPCFHNDFLLLLLGKLKFGTCKLLLTLVPQQAHYACVP